MGNLTLKPVYWSWIWISEWYRFYNC